MKRILFIILIIASLASDEFMLYANVDSIKKGDVLVDVKFKDEIPKIDSNELISIMIESSNNIKYFISYQYNMPDRPYILFIIYEYDENNVEKMTSYAYSWKELEEDLRYIYIPKGWSIHSESDDSINRFSPISKCPFESISGKVVYTVGDTWLLSPIFDFK